MLKSFTYVQISKSYVGACRDIVGAFVCAPLTLYIYACNYTCQLIKMLLNTIYIVCQYYLQSQLVVP